MMTVSQSRGSGEACGDRGPAGRRVVPGENGGGAEPSLRSLAAGVTVPLIVGERNRAAQASDDVLIAMLGHNVLDGFPQGQGTL